MAKKDGAQAPEKSRRANRLVTQNKRALFEYFILESIEAGIVLTGTEIKSVREGKVSISEAYVRVSNGELWLVGSNITPYTHGSYTNHDPDRPRKLLAHKAQIRELKEMIEQKGLTIVPLRIAMKDGLAKVEIGVARGKKLHDKRASEAEREGKRDIARIMKSGEF